VISTKALRVTYRPSRIEAISDVSVEIPQRTTTCIVGPNAAGKTTLLKAIARLVEYDGAIFIEGRDISELGKALRRILAYTSHVSVNELLGVRVIDVLLTSRYPISRGLADSEEDLEGIYEVSRSLGIEHLLTRRIGELSSGELQRVVLASALVRRPRILLLDEPDSHLDVALKPWLSLYLKKLSEGSTVVLSTHDPIFAFHTCDYFIVLSHGKLLYSGPYEDLINNATFLEKAYGIGFTRVELGDRVVLLPLYSALKAHVGE